MKPERIQVAEMVASAVEQKYDIDGELLSGIAALPQNSVASLQTVTRYRVSLVQTGHLEIPEVRIDSPAAAASFFGAILEDSPQEKMVAAFVDMRNMLIGWQEAFAGSLTRCAVEPRVMLQAALLTNAAGLLIGHNHPGGDPSPSEEDVAFTQRMREASQVVGVRLLDHVIVGAGEGWVSMKRRGVV